jgi:hypothetical protein
MLRELKLRSGQSLPASFVFALAYRVGDEPA